jgi:phospholipase C
MGITGINWDPQRHVRLIADDVRTRRVIQLTEPGGSVSAQASVPAKLPATEPPGKLFPAVRRGDIVGFADAGVWTALSNGDGTFQPPQFVIDGYDVQQGWQVSENPRFVADITGDGKADVVGFGYAGVWTALSNGDGTFQPPKFVIADMGVQQGWQVDLHPRFVADITGDGKADIVGFGYAGVWTALSNGDGTFQPPRLVVSGFDVQQGWQVDLHPRFVADITGDGKADIVGFGNDGVWVALSNGDGTFQSPRLVVSGFNVQQGWQVSENPRFVADITGDGKADIVGFGNDGVWVALSNGDGTFQSPRLVVSGFNVQQGWQVSENPRFVADITGDRKADIVGFGYAGVWTALSNGDGTFQPPQFVIADMGVQQGWQVDLHPRFVADITGDGKADIVGFGNDGVWVALSNGDGTFQAPRLVLSDFGAASGTAGIKHVFVLMLENRSFDHMLGFSPITGTDAMTGTPTATLRATGDEKNDVGATVYQVTAGADNSLSPPGPGHEFEDVLVQLAGPGATYPSGGPYPAMNNSGYAASFASHGGDPAEVMKCFTPGQLPVLNQLASEFAVCDHWFSSLPGPTFPNRFFVHAASSGGLDHSPSDAELSWWETVDGFSFPKGTIYDALDRAGLKYRFYACDRLPVVASLAGVSLLDIHDFGDHFAADIGDSDFASLQYVHLEPSYDILNDYRDGNSQHPLGDIRQGELFVKQAYEAIRNSPLWEDSLMIITWDEHGGFFDHVVPPPAVPPGDSAPATYNQHGFAFDQLGPRVPAIVISPRIPKNTVDHRVYDHASVPAAIERIFGVPPMTNRDQGVNAPNALLTLTEPRTDTPATLVEVAAGPAAAPSAPKTPQDPARPITDSSIVPFLQTAVIEDLKLADPAQRPIVIANAKTIATYGQAAAYITTVTQRVTAYQATQQTTSVTAGRPEPAAEGTSGQRFAP